jgi:tetratricopeptide (TPR) repeat protein
MRTIALAALSLLALPALVSAQGVRITLKDGTVLEGELEGYENGRYRLRRPGGAVETIDERRVLDVTLTERPSAAAPRTGNAAQEARAAFERGDFEESLRRVAEALRDLDLQREDLQTLAARAAQAELERLLEQRDAERLARTLRRVLPPLPAEGRRLVLTRLAERFADRFRSDPQDPFTGAFAETLAALVEEGSIEESLRRALADSFEQAGTAAEDRKDFAAAALFRRAAIKIDPSRRDALRPRLTAAALAEAAARLERGDPRGAARAAREALAADPDHAEARRIAEEAEFALLKEETEAAYGDEAAPLLRDFLARARRPEHRAWAEEALARLSDRPSPRPPEIAAQMRKYFPLRPGRYLLYRRGDGEMLEKVRVDSVARDGDLLRVYAVLEEIYRNYSTRMTYLLEIERDAVYLVAGAEREPLLKFPLRSGNVWTWQSAGRPFRRLVRSMGETVSVGRGDARRTYEDCLVVEFTSSVERDGATVPMTSRSTYAPGVGLVKLEFLERDFEKFNLELVETGQE